VTEHNTSTTNTKKSTADSLKEWLVILILAAIGAWLCNSFLLMNTEVPTGSMADTLGKKNPFWYRGYVYDEETGLYYLNSRYYDPKVGRFICADGVEQTLINNASLCETNLYSYCFNNPVVRKDPNGLAFETVFDLISLGTSILEVMANPYDPWAWAGLVGDVLDVAIPGVAGIGEVTKALKGAEKFKYAKKAVQSFTDASDIAAETLDSTVDTYRAVKKGTKGKGVEVHHLNEKRFDGQLTQTSGVKRSTNEYASTALSHAAHNVYTQRARMLIPYGVIPTGIGEIKAETLICAAVMVYRDNPKLMEAAIRDLMPYLKKP